MSGTTAARQSWLRWQNTRTSTSVGKAHSPGSVLPAAAAAVLMVAAALVGVAALLGRGLEAPAPKAAVLRRLPPACLASAACASVGGLPGAMASDATTRLLRRCWDFPASVPAASVTAVSAAGLALKGLNLLIAGYEGSSF